MVLPSDLLSILLSVTQGSILGPLLVFLITKMIKLCSFLFADDTTLLTSNSYF